MKPTIFIALPSLYDTELIPTVLGAFEAATYPERVVIGVSLMDDSKILLRQFKKQTKKYESQIRFKFTKINRKNATTLLGVGYGRKNASDLYQDEDYMLQFDSHTYLDKGWDESLIRLFHKAQKAAKNDKVVLTAYAGHYRYTQEGVRLPVPGADGSRYPYYIKHRWLSRYTPSWKDEPVEGKGFLPATKFNANFAFGDKQFANNTGVFEEAVFFEEEPIQSVNLRAAGFSLVFPILKKSIVYHYYVTAAESNGGYLGFRRNAYSYFTPKQVQATHQRNWDNWKDYVYDPANFTKIKDYENYCGTSLRYGVIKENYIPETY